MSTQGKIRVYKRENKKGFTYTYCIEAGINPATGKRQRVTKSGFKTAKEARAAAQPILNKLLLGENIIESDITFGEYAEQWLQEHKMSVKLTTIDNLISAIKVANRYFKHIKLKKITKRAYQQFINDYSNGRKRSTILARHIIIKNIFNHANKYNIIHTNPAIDITIPNIISKPKDIESLYLTKDELLEFLSYAKNKINTIKTEYFYTVCAIMAFTGMRVGEVCALSWHDIDLKNKAIHVHSSMFGHGINNYKKQDTPKNKSSIRIIKIGDTLIAILKEWKLKQLSLRLQCHITDSNKTNYVLTRYINNREYPVLSCAVNSLFHRIKQKNVFVKHIHCHIFRHTHVSLLAESGVPLEVIQERLGHSSDETTRKIYLHITEKQKDEAAKIFDEYLLAK